MANPKLVLLPAVAAIALSLSACNPSADTTSSRSAPGDPVRSAQAPSAPANPDGIPRRSEPNIVPPAPGSATSPSEPMSKEELERNREALPPPSGVTR